MLNRQKIILGTVQLGLSYGINNWQGQPSVEQSFDILDIAAQNQIRFLDTAAAYGSAEEVIGAYHQKEAQTFSVITKFHCKEGESAGEKVKQAISKLYVPHIDIMLFHSFNDFTQNPGMLSELVKEKEAGRIRQLGVSVYLNHEIDELLGIPEVEVIQAPFNLLDNEVQRGEIFRKAKALGKTIHTRSVFLQGLFFKGVNNIHERLKPLEKALQQLQVLSRNNQLSMSEMALAYACSKTYIDGVLVGVDSKEQLVENLKAASTVLPELLLNTLDEITLENIELLNPSKW
jgi:aryl-alcohol dehydrogenase-like predicted oxidoreductase